MLTAKLEEDFPVYVEYKLYACARPIHNAIDCALAIRESHQINTSDIQEISVRRHPDWADFHSNTQPRTYHEAQTSLPYSVAVALVEGKASFEQYSEEKLTMPQVVNLSKKIACQGYF